MEVNASALRRNLARLRKEVGEGTGLLPLVKADAYGVGLERAVSALEKEDPWGFGVATVEEGLAIRRFGLRCPVIVLSPAPRGVYREGILGGLTFSVSSVEAVRELSNAANALDRDLSLHVEVDTGMGRSGFSWRNAQEWGGEVEALTVGRVRWEGVFTHFHSADRENDPSIAEQVERFRGALALLPKGSSGERICHLGNSAGAFRRLAMHGDLIRPGIFLYGGVAGEGVPPPEEVVAVRGRIVLVRTVPPGTTVGYGAEYRSRSQERWATVGIGYGDGLPRALGGRGSGLLRGERVPIIGRISMDLTVVDITGIASGVEVGEVVTFIGSDGEQSISLEEVAEQAGTINYEILTGLTPRLPRIWHEDGQVTPAGSGDPDKSVKG